MTKHVVSAEAARCQESSSKCPSEYRLPYQWRPPRYGRGRTIGPHRFIGSRGRRVRISTRGQDAGLLGLKSGPLVPKRGWFAPRPVLPSAYKPQESRGMVRGRVGGTSGSDISESPTRSLRYRRHTTRAYFSFRSGCPFSQRLFCLPFGDDLGFRNGVASPLAAA